MQAAACVHIETLSKVLGNANTKSFARILASPNTKSQGLKLLEPGEWAQI
jgi:hypothetical protein